MKKLLLTGLILLGSFSSVLAQRNLYVKQLAADSIKARVDTVNFPYFFSGPFTQSRTTVAVNDTLLHEWVQNQSGGGGAFWPLTGLGTLTGATTIAGGNFDLDINGTNSTTIATNGTENIDLSSTEIRISSDATPIRLSNSANITFENGTFTSVIGPTYTITDANLTPVGISYNALYNFNDLGDNNLVQKGHVNANFWPLSGTGNITGALNTIQSSIEGTTGIFLDNLRNFTINTNDNATTQQRNSFSMSQGSGLQLTRLSPDNLNNYTISLNDNSITLLSGGQPLNRGYSVNINSATDAGMIIEDFNTVRQGIRYNEVYQYAPLTDQSLVQKRHLDSLTSDVAGSTVAVQQLITSAELLAGNTTPIELVAAQGVGTYIQITSPVTYFLSFGTAAYTTNTTIDVQYGGGIQASTSINILAQTGDAISQDPAGFLVSLSGNVINQPLELIVDTGDPLVGDGEIIVSFTYQIKNF